MPKITASVPHQLPRAEARRRIQEQLGQFRQQHGTWVTTFRENWDGDTMDFSVLAMGESITGRMFVEDQVVRLEVDLPGLLGLLASTIQQAIERQGRLLLGGPRTG